MAETLESRPISSERLLPSEGKGRTFESSRVRQSFQALDCRGCRRRGRTSRSTSLYRPSMTVRTRPSRSRVGCVWTRPSVCADVAMKSAASRIGIPPLASGVAGVCLGWSCRGLVGGFRRSIEPVRVSRRRPVRPAGRAAGPSWPGRPGPCRGGAERPAPCGRPAVPPRSGRPRPRGRRPWSGPGRCGPP